MKQPPDDPFYNNPTENVNWPARWPDPAQNHPQPNYPPYPPQQNPGSQPGFTPLPPQGFTEQSPVRQEISIPTRPGKQSFSPASAPGPFAGQPAQQQPLTPPNPGNPFAGPSPQPFSPASAPGPFAGQPAQQQPLTPPNPGNPFAGPPPQSFSPASAPGPFAGHASETIMEQGDFRQPAQQQGGSYSPPPWPDLTKSEPPQKKSSKGLLIVISVIVVLLLIIGGGSAFALLRGKGSHTSQTNATTPSANGTASKAVTPALPTPTTPANPVTGNTGTVGQPIQAGANWIVTVTHVDETNSSAIPPVPGQAYLEINISLKNTQATSQLVSSLLQFTLVDSSGHSYHEAVGDTNVRQPLDANVAPGQTLSGQLPYEVPQSMHTFVLTFKYALISGSNASISWALHV